jgi:hypothetical protein
MSELQATEEDEFVDLSFELTEIQTTQSPEGTSVHLFYFRGGDGDSAFELAVGVCEDWDEDRPTGSPFSFYWSDLAVGVVSTNSSNFLRVLAAAYDLQTDANMRMKDVVNARAVSMGRAPTNLLTERTHLKVFFAEPLHNEYGEFYLNIDPTTQRVELNEKDPEYRGAILRGFAQT